MAQPSAGIGNITTDRFIQALNRCSTLRSVKGLFY